jgi:hypothetical protein
MRQASNTQTASRAVQTRGRGASRIRLLMVEGLSAVLLAAAPAAAHAAFDYATGREAAGEAAAAPTNGPAENGDPATRVGGGVGADGASRRPAHACDVPAEVTPEQEPVANLVRAFKEDRPLTIVVMGSLSGGANPPVKDVPAFAELLQASLEREMASRALDIPLRIQTVGRLRALTSELAALIRREVLPLKPSLVIWQVGRGDARQAIPPHRFSQSLKEGLDILQEPGIPTILADFQFHPQFEAMYRTDDYRNYVRWVAGKRDLPLLRRYEMIEHWVSAGSVDLDSGEEAKQQAAYRFIQECLAYQAAQLVLSAAGVTPR